MARNIVSAETARRAIPTLIMTGEFVEVSWVTGKHCQDPDYAVGKYVTPESFGDYTDHPRYSGVYEGHRPDDETAVSWVVSHLPESGMVKITTN